MKHLPHVRTEAFETLIVDFARSVGARSIVKGLRAISDFEYEAEMNQLNRLQGPDVESVYLMASPAVQFPQFERHQRARDLRRQHRGAGHAARRTPPEGRAGPVTNPTLLWTSWY